VAFVDQRHKETQPHVEYKYSVEGTEYTSRQISFDLLGDPGGRGGAETVVARYPVGRSVAVYYVPDNPATAILEPGDYSQFYYPLLFGVLFLIGGIATLWRMIRSKVASQRAAQAVSPLAGVEMSAAFISILIYAALLVAWFEFRDDASMDKVFGKRPLGLSGSTFVLLLMTLLYLPLPWGFWHLMRLSYAARAEGSAVDLGSFFSPGNPNSPLTRSRKICRGCLVYVFAVMALWIVYASVMRI
jgi:hypothetical protein